MGEGADETGLALRQLLKPGVEIYSGLDPFTCTWNFS